MELESDLLLQNEKHEHVFPLGRRPSIGPEPPVNPFQDLSPKLSYLEVLKTIVILPIFVLRVIFLLLTLAIAYLCVRLSLIGVKDPLQKPFSAWRRGLLWSIRILARITLFLFGYYWIPVKGRSVPREEAPIVVSNHISFFDPLYIFYSHMPVILSAKENVEMPIVGMFLTALQIIPVDRSSPTSRRDAAAQIKRRARDNRWPHILIFPEGTTTNGLALISFKTGAFSPGLPIQPMVFRYPNKKVSPAWVDKGLIALIFRLLTQFINYMEVEYLPVVEPTEKDMKDPHEFAERVRRMMATSLMIPCTEHSFLDMKLKVAARRLQQPQEHSLMEISRLEKLFNIDYATIEEYLKKFSSMDITHSGQLHLDEFVDALDLPHSQYAEEVFHFFDKSEKGYINFKEFVASLAFISSHTSFSGRIEAAFRACDLDKDGRLSRIEVERSLLSIFPDMEKSKISNLFQTLDLDQDGVISWDEFRTFLQRNPEYLALIMAAHPQLLK